MRQPEEIFNQSTPLVGVNLYATDAALRDAVAAHGGGAAAASLSALGSALGRAETLAAGDLANRNPPRLVQYDAVGHRVDEVEFHPAWHQLMAMLIGAGTHASPWLAAEPAAHVVRAARYLLFSQVENGTQCPVTMTFAAIPVLRKAAQSAPGIADDWLPKVMATEHDPRGLPVTGKRGALVGMGMTERQGGSDVRANTTLATVAGPSRHGDAYRLRGHKWFFSVPQADAHLVLAQTDATSPAGISCFLLPRHLPDGSRNAVRVLRLKDKVGNRSNASAEVEFADALAWRVGPVGRGIQTILEMGNLTRLDCAIGSAGQMRAVVARALHHAAERRAFGRLLRDQPLMRSVLADLALESEAATHLVLRLARALDHRADDPLEAALVRVLTPLAKYWICKRGPAVGAEAMEVLGGNGYVEDAPLARFYRELPLNSIWEGSGNVMCLDLLRALGRTPGAQAAVSRELVAAAQAAGASRIAASAAAAYARCVDAVHADLLPLARAGAATGGEQGAGTGASNPAAGVTGANHDEAAARRQAQVLALALQAALLIRHAPAFVAEAFCLSRLADRHWGAAFGTLPTAVDPAPIVARATPAA